MTATEAMERTTGNEGNASKSESEAKAHDQRAPAADDAHRTPNKKRRKVNHGELGAMLSFRRHVSPAPLPLPCVPLPPWPLHLPAPRCRALKLIRARSVVRSLSLLPSICKSQLPMRRAYTQPLSTDWPSPSRVVRPGCQPPKSTLQQHTDAAFRPNAAARCTIPVVLVANHSPAA